LQEQGKEPSELDKADIVEDRFYRLVREALEKELITISRAAEILSLSLEDMRELTLSWKLKDE